MVRIIDENWNVVFGIGLVIIIFIGLYLFFNSAYFYSIYTTGVAPSRSRSVTMIILSISAFILSIVIAFLFLYLLNKTSTGYTVGKTKKFEDILITEKAEEIVRPKEEKKGFFDRLNEEFTDGEGYILNIKPIKGDFKKYLKSNERLYRDKNIEDKIYLCDRKKCKLETRKEILDAIKISDQDRENERIRKGIRNTFTSG